MHTHGPSREPTLSEANVQILPSVDWVQHLLPLVTNVEGFGRDPENIYRRLCVDYVPYRISWPSMNEFVAPIS